MPVPRPPYVPQMARFRDWLASERGLRFADYEAMRQWSIDDMPAFWQAVWDYFRIESPTPATSVLSGAAMPGAHWFEGVRVNYARQVLRHVEPAYAAGVPALIARNERGEHREIDWRELRRQVASMALHLRAQGLQPGDRVAAYLPNVPEAMIAFLAVVSLGGIWSICAPDMGTAAVLDRFKQIEPTVLIACDGVRYGGRDIDRTGVVAELRAALPTVRHLIVHRGLPPGAVDDGPLASFTEFADTVRRDGAEVAAFEPLALPFEHPIWIVYSSGTTGLPKPIVHGHGGAMIVGLVLTVIHNDIGASYDANSFGERFHWYSSTGWVMWNAQMHGLLNGTTCCVYDGNPGGSKENPDWGVLWRFAADLQVTFFGAGAAFFGNCMKAGVQPSALDGLRQVRVLGTTGSPLSEDVQRWGTRELQRLWERTGVPNGIGRAEPGNDGPAVWWCNMSGGTDFAGAFIGGNRELPQVPGEMQCRLLGCAVEAWNEQGRPVVGEVGELVCTRPIPSMPLYFWNDEGQRRYLSSYFDMYPGVWRHGDWLKVTPEGRCIIYGRSDATINRHGLRMGTSELYSAVEALPEVLDSMVVDLEFLGRDSYMPLFVVLRPGVTLDDPLQRRIHAAIRTALSPRFLPDQILQVAEIPRTLSGKKQELPIKKLLLGQPLEKVVNPDAMANPGCLAWYVEFAQRRAAGTA